MPYSPPSGNQVDLVFKPRSGQANGGAINLVFGASSSVLILGATVQAVDVDDTADVVALRVATLHQATVAAWESADDGSVVAVYDANTFRGVQMRTGPGWMDVRPARRGLSGSWVSAAQVKRGLGLPWTDVNAVRTGIRGSWSGVRRMDSGLSAAFLDSHNAPGFALTIDWSGPPEVSVRRMPGWLVAVTSARGWTVSHRSPPQRRLGPCLRWQAPIRFERAYAVPHGRAAKVTRRPDLIVWQQGHAPAWAPRWPVTVPPVTPPASRTMFDLVFAWPRIGAEANNVSLFFNRHAPNHVPVIILVGGSYLVPNTVSIVRLPDRTPVEAIGVRLSIDRESWAWGLSLELAGPAAMASITPTAGDPVSVEVAINGYLWTALVEQYTENRTFGEVRYQAQGRSTAAVLAAPYSVARSYSATTNKLAAQICDDELLNTGWSMVYDTSLMQLMTMDWLVPAGAWSYQDKTPMDAIGQVANAIGARLYADRRNQTLRVAPRYPVSVWDWATSQPDVGIPESLITSFGTRLEPKPNYDQVFVSGQNQGVLASVRRTGTAGNHGAPMVVDPLITHLNAARERGRNILSAGGKQARVTLDIPLIASPGLIEPGALVEVSATTGSWRGVSTGVTVSAAFGVVSQSVEIERHWV